MEYMGQKPERRHDAFEEEQRIRALESLSDNWPPPSEHDEAVACIEACAGIDTALLWPGAMGEMVGALDNLVQCAVYHAKRNETIPPDNEHLVAARAILAKLGNN